VTTRGSGPGGEKALAAGEEVVDAVLRASRVLVSVAARSLAAVDEDVTLPQFRALVVLASRGPQTAGALAAALGVHASTATRMCDRLVAKGFVDRDVSATNRREVHLELTRSGRRLVDVVTKRRRKEIARVIERVPRAQREALIQILHAFGEAAEEPADSGWYLGWAEE
jgi:DNA-binding MarR family transcriptional regulator